MDYTRQSVAMATDATVSGTIAATGKASGTGMNMAVTRIIGMPEHRLRATWNIAPCAKNNARWPRPHVKEEWR